MNEMKQHIVKLEEDLAAAKAAGPKTSSEMSSPVTKTKPPNLEHPSISESPSPKMPISPKAAARVNDVISP